MYNRRKEESSSYKKNSIWSDYLPRLRLPTHPVHDINGVFPKLRIYPLKGPKAIIVVIKRNIKRPLFGATPQTKWAHCVHSKNDAKCSLGQLGLELDLTDRTVQLDQSPSFTETVPKTFVFVLQGNLSRAITLLEFHFPSLMNPLQRGWVVLWLYIPNVLKFSDDRRQIIKIKTSSETK